MKALPIEPSSTPMKIGSRLRAARQEKRMSMSELAAASSLTKGFISRMERDLSSPSVTTLVSVCQALNLDIGELFRAPQTHLVTWREAPKVDLGGSGISEKLITERSEHRVQIIKAEIKAGGHGEQSLYAVDCDLEVLHVISGKLTLRTSERDYALEAGDTISFSGREPHSWENPHSTPAVVTWTLVPAAAASK